jgi:hypothetical protein
MQPTTLPAPLLSLSPASVAQLNDLSLDQLAGLWTRE